MLHFGDTNLIFAIVAYEINGPYCEISPMLELIYMKSAFMDIILNLMILFLLKFLSYVCLLWVQPISLITSEIWLLLRK